MNNQPLKCCIVDDASQARILLQLMLKELFADIQVVKMLADPRKLPYLLDEQPIDLVFLDIEMPDENGLVTAQKILEKHPHTSIIFTTAYQEHAVQAFRLAAVDYLLKPIVEQQLMQAVEKVYVKIQNQQRAAPSPFISLPQHQTYLNLHVNQIEYLMADGSYVEVVLTDRSKLLVSKNLKYFEQLLVSHTQFVRVHRSYIVNLNEIQSVKRQEKSVILMKSGTEIDLARERKQHFWSIFRP